MQSVKELRIAQCLSQEELAKQAGLTFRTINLLESGEIKKPRFATVRALARVFKMTPGDLWKLWAVDEVVKPDGE
jgi:transcriptional regulator with XRE-family HTH domain